ncbi:MAG: hypothetical protein AAF499_01280, partial [Pseudomonadota bacterium]
MSNSRRCSSQQYHAESYRFIAEDTLAAANDDLDWKKFKSRQEEVFKQRRTVVQKVCNNIKHILPQSDGMLPMHLLWNYKMELVNCPVPKVGSTTWKYIFA